MKATFKSLIIFILLGFIGCEKGNNYDRLLSTKWIFTGLYHIDTHVTEIKPPELEEMTIRFKNENLVLARGVCNSMFGNYSISGQNCIKVSDLIQTMIYCGNTWEKLYFDLIHDLASYNVYNNSLILRTSSNIDMHFKAE